MDDHRGPGHVSAATMQPLTCARAISDCRSVQGGRPIMKSRWYWPAVLSALMLAASSRAFAQTEFFEAARTGNVETLRQLLTNGADREARTGDGDTALILAA